MMRALLYKELLLTSLPPMFIFMFFGAMLMIPGYPYYVPFFFGCLGLFFTFQNGRENKDTFYTAALPISKGDVVRARCLLVVLVELGEVLISVPFAVLRVYVLPPNPVGIEPNPAFYGFVLIMFTIFNVIFLTQFYKTAYNVGKAFVIAQIPLWLYIIVMEALVHFPVPGTYLDTANPSMMLRQLPILAAGIVIYILGMFLACRISIRRFEKVDL